MTELPALTAMDGPLPAVAGDGVADDQLRASGYRLLSNLLAAPPSAETLDLLRSIEVPPEGAASMLGSAWAMLRVAAGRATPDSVDDEFHALFVGLGRGELVPYGSWYITGFLMEQPLARLRADLARLGIARQESVREPEDHAAALCDVMALTIGGEEPASLEEQAAFFARHIEPWMGRFFRDLQRAGSAHFYRAVGQLGEQFIEVESKYLRMPDTAAGSTGELRADARSV